MFLDRVGVTVAELNGEWQNGDGEQAGDSREALFKPDGGTPRVVLHGDPYCGVNGPWYRGVAVVAANTYEPPDVTLLKRSRYLLIIMGVVPDTRPDQHVPEPRLAPDARDVVTDAGGQTGPTHEQRLEAERRRLREREQQLIASFGDRDITSDRADQAQLLEGVHELQWVRHRIAEISQLMADLRQPQEQARSGRIGIGATVDLEYQDGSRETVWLGSPGLAHADETVVTPSSPLGQALLGHRAGDTVDYTTPASPQWVRVLAVRSARSGSEAATSR